MTTPYRDAGEILNGTKAPEYMNDADVREYGTPAQLAALYAALAEARKSFRPVRKNKHVKIETKSGRDYEYDYATLSEMVDATAPALAEHGVTISQPFTMLDVYPPEDPKLDALRQAIASPHPEVAKEALALLPKLPSPQPSRMGRMRTIVAHKDGGRLVSTTMFYPAGDIKDLGGQTTYLARYTLQRMLGIDGEADMDEMPSRDGDLRAKTSDRKPKSSPPTPTKKPEPAEPPHDPRTGEVHDEPPPPEPTVEYDEPPASTDDGPMTEATKAAIRDQCVRLNLRGKDTADISRIITSQSPKDITEDNALLLLKALEAFPNEKTVRTFIERRREGDHV